MKKYWQSENESGLRRYGTCGPPYHGSSDRHRYQPESQRRSTRSYPASAPEHHIPDSDQDSERDGKESRRRIPVACGRCRKRKIRCSGPQNDESCLNCKNAGNSECQFNRVSSEEVTFKSSVDFGYNTELARVVQVRGSSQGNSYRPVTPNYSYGPIPITTNVSIPYRNHPNPDYQYEQKSASTLPSFSTDYNDDGLDYSISGSPYHGYGPEAVGGLANYSSYGPGRHWYPATQSSRPSINGVYYGSHVAAYGPPQAAFSNAAYGLRPSVSSELSSFSFSDMNSSLPTSESTNGHGRVLPPISGGRSNSALPTLHRLANEVSYNSSTMNGATVTPLEPTQLMTAGHSAPLNYLSQSANADSVDGYNCGDLPGMLSQQAPDLYGANDNWTLAPLTTDPMLRSPHSASDLYFSSCGDTTTTTRKASQSGQSAGTNHSLTTPSHHSSSDLYSYHSSDDNSRKASQSEQSSEGSNAHNNTTPDVYYTTHGNDVARKASKSGQGGKSSNSGGGSSGSGTLMNGKSMSSKDAARAARQRASTGNLRAASSQ